MIRAIAYRLQEIAHGGASKATLRRLTTLAVEFETGGTIAPPPSPKIKPGSRLVREWHGRTHTVTVTDDGFEFQGKSYRSLTKIAHDITGAKWSGPRFFGLTQRSATAAATPDKRAIVAHASRFDADQIVIEDKSSGIQLIQDLRNEGVRKVVEYKTPPGADKVMRLHACSDRFENGRVFLPRSAPWLDEYVTELVGFPGTKHDDQVDSTTQALDHLREPDVVTKFLKAFPPDGRTNTLLGRRLGLC
jgi:predicted phage terminase large subunit-like protein